MPVDELTQLIERLRSMESKIDHLCGLMDGNSDPEKGMIVRMDRLERKQIEAQSQRAEMAAVMERRQSWFWTAVISLGGAVLGSLAMCLFGIWLHYK